MVARQRPSTGATGCLSGALGLSVLRSTAVADAGQAGGPALRAYRACGRLLPVGYLGLTRELAGPNIDKCRSIGPVFR